MCEVGGKALDLPSLVEWVFPNLAQKASDTAWIAERAILAPLNTTVDELNAAVLESFPGDAVRVSSADMVIEEADADSSSRVPVEFLNAEKPSGLYRRTSCISSRTCP